MKREYTDEELMREAGEILADARLADFEKRMEEEHVFSARSMRRFRRQVSGRGSRRSTAGKTAGKSAGKRWSVRGAAILAAAVFLSVAAVALGPGRGAFARTFVKVDSPKRFEFSFIKNANPETAEKAVSDRPLYLPPRYVVWQDNSMNDLVLLLYGTGENEGNWISYHRFDLRVGEEEYLGGAQHNSSELDIRHETVYVGSYEGMFIYGITKDGRETNYSLYWVDSEYRYALHSSSVTKEELLHIAGSIYGMR